MKLKLTTALLATAGAVFFLPSAEAQTVSYNNTDMILGIRATGGTGVGSDIEVNLGAAANFTGASNPLGLNGPNALAVQDIIDTYGAGWNTRTDLLWSVSAVDTSSKAVWASAPRVPNDSSGTSNPWHNFATVFTANPVVSKIQSMDGTGGTGFSGSPQTANSTVTTIQATSAANSYASFMTGTASFGYFNPTIENSLQPGSTSDLYQLSYGNNNNSALVGSLGWDSSGNLTFTPSPVPEPSTASLFAGLGLLALLLRYRLRRQKA